MIWAQRSSQNSMKTLNLKGAVSSGKSEGARFIELPWVRKQIVEKIGFNPYPGTLNLKLTNEEVKRRALLNKAEAIEISPATGFSSGKCFKAHLRDNVRCAVVIPETRNYHRDVIEVIAPTNLRDKLTLEDGDYVEVRILLR